MRKRILLFFVAFATWSLLNWPPDWEHLLVGILVAGFVSYMTGDLFVYNEMIFKSPRRAFYFICVYLPLFLFQMIRACLAIAYRIVNPFLPIRPGIVKIKTSLKTDTALTFLANTITLATLAMTVDIDREQGILYLHWVNVKNWDSLSQTKLVVDRFERVLKEIFE